MLTIDDIRLYCLSKKRVTESFPFDQNTLVFKVHEKLFLLTNLTSWELGSPKINLKCDPEYALTLRDTYPEITPGFHMNKKHWNTIELNTNPGLKRKIIFTLIDLSYQLVVLKLSKKIRDDILKN